jgi:hypothetical protein
LATRIFLGEFLDLDHTKIAVIGLGYVGLPLGSTAGVFIDEAPIAIEDDLRP